MKKIASFCVNHDVLEKGLYTSRIDGDIVTYDIRMVKPNKGGYFSTAAGHTFEHLFATFARNSAFAQNIIYAGPMGCRTGFYLLVRDMKPSDVIKLIQQTMDFVASFEGAIPGAESSRECGNYLDHDLAGAKALAQDMRRVLEGWTPEKLVYQQ